jgi:hypothetical protein
MASIKMPATPRSAYDPTRPPNGLLLAHVRELEKAVVAAGRRVRRQKPASEGQAAAYIRHLNRALHQQVLLPPMRRRPLDVPLTPPRRTTSRTVARKQASATLRKKKPSAARKRRRSKR